MRLKPEHWLGLIAVLGTFAAAIAGAWVGGSIANNGARDLQRDQARREEARELAAARTAARMFVAELVEVNNNAAASAANGCWLRLDYTLDLSRDDRRLLATKLPRREWSAVLFAYKWEDILSMERGNGFDSRYPESSLDVNVAIAVVERFHRIVPLLGKFAPGETILVRGAGQPGLGSPVGAPTRTYPSPEFCGT